VLAQLAALSDAELLAAAKKSKVKIEVYDKKYGVRFVPILDVHPDAKALRKALAKGSKEWSEMINSAPILLWAVVDRDAALALARGHADSVVDPYDPFRAGVLMVLGASEAEEDFERVWNIFERTRDGEDVLRKSKWPWVDARLCEALQRALGAAPDWNMPWDDAKNAVLVRLVWRRDFPPGVQLIEEAARAHPWKWFFNPPAKLRGKR
jgi:hypothetical protein